MNVYLAWTFTVLYYLVYPFVKVVQLALLALTPVWHGIEFALLPLAYLGRFIMDMLYLPFSIIGKFEVSFNRVGSFHARDWSERSRC